LLEPAERNALAAIVEKLAVKLLADAPHRDAARRGRSAVPTAHRVDREDT
jgi:hypothetical protein